MSYELKNTFQIQAESLRQFMDKLGYRPARPNGGWYTSKPELAANSILSTRTAIVLHNAVKEDWLEVMPGWYGVPHLNASILVNAYALNQLQAAKLVHKVKLVPVRKALNGFRMPVSPNANLIKVMDPAYWAMFGIEQ